MPLIYQSNLLQHYFLTDNLLILTVLDNLLQHVWTNFKKPSCPFTCYDSLKNSIRFTDRDWNAKVAVIKILRHISLSINADINLIQFMQTPNEEKKFHQCDHKGRCYMLKYQFQSSLVKLLFEADFYAITLLQYKNTYYIINVPVPLAPFLINQPRHKSIEFMDFTVTSQDVSNIIKNTPLTLPKPFSVALYSAFTYIGNYPYHQPTQSNNIGWYQGHNHHTCHIFVTPLVNSTTFTLTFLNSSDTHKNMQCLKNTYSTPHITEGNPTPMPNQKISEEPLLNQDFCVCQHPTTKIFTVPGNHSFKPLGNKNFNYTCLKMFSLSHIFFQCLVLTVKCTSKKISASNKSFYNRFLTLLIQLYLEQKVGRWDNKNIFAALIIFELFSVLPICIIFL